MEPADHCGVSASPLFQNSAALNDFVAAFDDADLVVLTDIYAPPRRRPSPVSAPVMLADKIRERGRPVVRGAKQQDLAAFLDGCAAGDLVVVMGAGPIWRAYELLERLADD